MRQDPTSQAIAYALVEPDGGEGVVWQCFGMYAY